MIPKSGIQFPEKIMLEQYRHQPMLAAPERARYKPRLSCEHDPEEPSDVIRERSRFGNRSCSKGQCRSVAQPGRAPRSGRGGRRFKSCHSDQPLQGRAEIPRLSADAHQLRSRQVHKATHKRVLRMVTLRRDSRGNYSARKRLPHDVRKEVCPMTSVRNMADSMAHTMRPSSPLQQAQAAALQNRCFANKRRSGASRLVWSRMTT